ncbi:MAG: DUF58 domain-containing protein [Candidatus Thorarchaeota archaeon]|nr:MAG: DUF58 domain-containing protein [Candidatus Thorarchaeota archaeon]
MITGLSQRIMISTLGFILLGMLMGNMMLIYIGFIPIVYVAIGFIIQPPSNFQIVCGGKIEGLEIDDKINQTRNLTVSDGYGPVIIYEEWPQEFQLVNGSNINIYWKGFDELNKVYSYEFLCTHRGIYEIKDIQIQGNHPFELRAPISQIHKIDQTLVVNPKPSRVKNVQRRNQYTVFPNPIESRIKLGAPTSDFKEIREYNYGDSYKSINWKATARLNTTPSRKPAVNEYEREGRRVTWIFLDKSEKLLLGNSIKNSFEYAIQAATSLAEYYISKQCRVGFVEYISNPLEKQRDTWFRPFEFKQSDQESPQPVKANILYPEAGNMQLYKIQRRLLEAKTEQIGLNLLLSIRQARRHIHGTNPLFIIITNLNHQSVGSLNESINELQKYTPRLRSQRTNIMIINVSGYKLASNTDVQKMASNVLYFEETELSHIITSPSVLVINWDPAKQDLIQRLLDSVRQG